MSQSKPRVVHCKRERFDVYIGRPGFWGNQFHMRHESERHEVIERYRQWLLTSPEAAEHRRRLPELAGKALACWCAPKACHGDVLVEAANKGLAVETTERRDSCK